MSDIATQALLEARDARAKAEVAEAKIDSHRDACADRYKEILDNQLAGATDRARLWEALTKFDEGNREGFKELRGLLLKGAFAIMTALLGAVLALGKYILTLKGM